jgi:outer membrane receptor protein involved in Fe transport
MLNTKVSKAVRLAIAFGAASTAAFSANTFAADEEGAEKVERIEVTGSRIKRTDIETASPVQITSAEEIKVAGFTRVEDMMNSLPQIEASSTAFQSNGATGTATLDLRGMGAQRTLVLINGRRAQAGGIYTQSVDINQIPAALIKQVEVLTGGGSSTYGADAVAGVVNFVMDDEFEGLEINLGGTGYQHNNDNKYIQGLMDEKGFEYPTGDSGIDGTSFDFSATLGGSFADGKGHAVGYITYLKQNELRQEARDYSSCALNSTGESCGGSGNAVVPNFYIAKVVDGAFDWSDYDYWTLNGSSDFIPSSGNLYNYAPINHFMRPDEKHTFGMFANYEISDSFQPYMETMFMRDRTIAQIAESGTFFNENYMIDYDSPLLNDSQRKSLTDRFGLKSGDQFATYIGKRNVEGGPRAANLEHTSFRMVLGTKGEINDLWSYDVTAQFGSTSSSTAYINDFFGPRIATALSANGEDCATTSGCIPYNVFTYEGVTAESAGSLTGTAIMNGVTEQFIVGGFVTGEFEDIAFPGSEYPVAAVFGAEYREEIFSRTADEVFAQGLLLGQGGTTKSLNGEYDVTEFYTELNVPLIQGVTGVESLTLDLGYRYSDYSTSGGEPAYKVALDWNVTPEWKVRSSFNRAVRAANNGELFAEQSTGLWGGTDPCAGATPSLSAAQCANTGVTASQYGNITESPASQYNGFFGGNPDLSPEIADTMTLGVVGNPTDNFNFTLDYWDIQLEDAIGTIGAEIMVEQCAKTGDATFCDNVQRTPGSGSLWVGSGRVVATNVNLGKMHYEGVDLSMNYNMEIGDGQLSTNLIGTYMLTKEFDEIPGVSEIYDCVSTLENGCFAQPKWRHVATVSYDTGSFWRATMKWRYYGEVTEYEGNDVLVQDGIGAQSYLDLKGSFELNDYTRVLVGVNNVLDKEPPMVGGTISTNANAISGFYDTLGRYLHASVTFKF